jgi:crotonobetaine/carnitine-CoA ligase
MNMSHSPLQGHSDPRVPSRETCVTRYLVDRWAAEKPDEPYALFEDGTHWSYASLKDHVVQLASGLQELGISQGEHVALWLPSDRNALLAFHAINYIGAVFVPFNTAYKGDLLAHVLENSDARILICHASLVERLDHVALAGLERLAVVGEYPAEAALPVTPWTDLLKNSHQLQPLQRPIEPWDSQSIIYTSGTTGPSKGVLSSYLHLYTNAGPDGWPFVREDDRFLVNMPIFHIGGTGLPFTMLARGGSIALMENFSTETFWTMVKETQCTVIFLLGVMATFLLKREPSKEDLDHSVRLAFVVPLTENSGELRSRFGIDVYSIFNMTEVSTPTFTQPNPAKLGTCGRPRPAVDVRLVDGNDCEVAIGEVGEMIVRTDRPWGMNSGYYKNPEATAKAWRNGWFHTGDAFRRDEEGDFYFVDRMKDAIRRRGENISSFEVESQIMAHPSVREAAAIGVPSAYSEDEVMVVVAPVDGHEVDFIEMFEFAASRLPYFMVPRYFRVVPELPKTPTAKVQKARLRDEGITQDTWDREAAGLRLKRESFQ